MIIDQLQSPTEAPPPSAELPDYASAVRSQPPRYFRNIRPSQPITYSFTQWSSGSMLLLSPATPGSPDQSSIYQISASLNLNPFLPVSFVTDIYRAGPYAGDLVAKFELSLNQRRGVLTVGDTTTRILNVLSTINADIRHWRWSFDDVHLRWDCRTNLDDGSPMCICYAMDASTTQLASFVPPPPDASPPIPTAVLTVFPDGHEDDFFDHILLSALIIERKMTMSY